MPLRTIQVVQNHNLGIDVAKQRLVALAQQPHVANGLKIIEANWTEATHTLTFTADAGGVVVYGTVVITANSVELVTEPLPLIAIPFIWYAEHAIKDQFAKSLAP